MRDSRPIREFLKRRYLPFVAAVAATLFGLAGATSELGVAQFRQDLQFFARELPSRHKNAFHYTTREQFQAAVDQLASRLDKIDEDGFYAGVKRIASMIGDAHTNVNSPREASRNFPIVVRDFGDSYRVLQVSPGYEKALGTRLVKIDNTPAERFYAMLSPLATQNENPSYAPALVNVFLRDARLLHGAGIAAKSQTARFTFEDDSGRQFELDIPSVSAEQFQREALVPLAKKRLDEIAEPMHNPAPTFGFTYVSSARAVYASVRSMRDVSGPARELFQFIRERHPDKLIVDLRQNPGGDYFHGLHGLIEPIAKLADLNRKGHLFVLIGPLTGSAAVINASQFHAQTQAILVGEPIGAKPAEYAEVRTMSLPNTHLVVGYSVKFYDFAYNQENVVSPDYEIKPTWDDVKTGRPTVLEWCLQYKLE